MDEEKSAKSGGSSGRGYWLGLGTGVALGMILVLVALALFVMPIQRDTFAVLSVDRSLLPKLTRIVLTPYWCWGSPALLAVFAVYLNLTRSRVVRAAVSLAVALIGAGLVVASALGLVMPLAPLMAGS
ncbi:MAG: hypothetical protein JW797_17220 [Bradymonadales bacterium]|nr:hypothetical protein [Bradymonadales bacterium]